jgi:hypothetical protein
VVRAKHPKIEETDLRGRNRRASLHGGGATRDGKEKDDEIIATSRQCVAQASTVMLKTWPGNLGRHNQAPPGWQRATPPPTRKDGCAVNYLHTYVRSNIKKLPT